MKYEEEQALVIRGDNPKAIADKIASLTSIGNYKLITQPDLFMTDTYLNTDDRDIKGGSLRIRSLPDEGKDLITWKGSNLKKFSDKDGTLRKELEVEWPWAYPSVWDVAKLFEFKSVQQRKTNRRVRNLHYQKKTNLLAEIAIDEVCYNFGKTQAKFYEIEIERKNGSTISIDDLAELFIKKFPNLEKWNNSKLSTGQMLRLALDIKLDEDGIVTDSSFDKLSVLLS